MSEGEYRCKAEVHLRGHAFCTVEFHILRFLFTVFNFVTSLLYYHISTVTREMANWSEIMCIAIRKSRPSS